MSYEQNNFMYIQYLNIVQMFSFKNAIFLYRMVFIPVDLHLVVNFK